VARVAAAAAYAWVAGSFQRFSWPATMAVFVPGAVALALALRAPAGPRRPARRINPRGGALWLGLFLAFCLWEVVAFLYQPSPTVGSLDHPTLSVLTDPILAHHPARSLALLGWLGIGRAVLRR
jgi:hypothetical protein